MFDSSSHICLGKSGMACGQGYCYETSAATFSVSSTVTTTNSKGDIITTTVTEATVITPGPGPGTSDPTSTAAMVIATSIPKLAAIEVDNGQGKQGLTQAQLGGIIAAVIIVLIAISLAAFFIIRRLRKTAEIVQAAESRRGTSSGNQRSHKHSFGQPSISEVDGFDINPSMQSPSIRPSHLRSGSDTSYTERWPNSTTHAPSTSSTPPVWPGQFNAAQIREAPSEAPVYNSVDTSNAAYAVSQHSQQVPQSQRVSYDSQGSHSRHWSNASELDSDPVGGPAKSELEDSAAGQQEASRRRASTSAARSPPRPAPHVRRGSGGGARGRSESAAAAVPLGTVNEFSEMHGYYGPPNHAVGETAERLGRDDSPASSTTS